MEYYEVFTSEENDYTILNLKLDLTELASLVDSTRTTNLTALLDEITHRAYEAGLRDAKSYQKDMEARKITF